MTVKQSDFYSISNSIATEEEIEEISNTAISHLGLPGQYDFAGDLPNVVISTSRHGKIWYGDTDKTSVSNLADVLKMDLSIESRE